MIVVLILAVYITGLVIVAAVHGNGEVVMIGIEIVEDAVGPLMINLREVCQKG